MDAGIIKKHLINQEVVAMPTDTVYGLIAMASSKNAVNEIYRLKNRHGKKPPTFIIASDEQLCELSIQKEKYQEHINNYWPGPVSLIMACKDKKLQYLHRGLFSLAVRVPKLLWLRELASGVGPLASSSANLEGMKIATEISEAKAYFGKRIKLYIDGGKIYEKPSKIIDLTSQDNPVVRI